MSLTHRCVFLQKYLIQEFFCILLVSVCTILMLAEGARAQEGTKQLIPGQFDRMFIEVYGDGSNFATYDAEPREQLNIYLKAGEKLHLGMKMSTVNGDPTRTTFRVTDPNNIIVFPQTTFPDDATDVGFIDTRDQAVAGPNGVTLNVLRLTTDIRHLSILPQVPEIIVLSSKPGRIQALQHLNEDNPGCSFLTLQSPMGRTM